MREKALAIVSLFASTSTLLCCALPALLVTLGLGAVVAGAVSSVPWLVPLSRNKEWMFLGAGLLLAVNWVLMRRWERTAAGCAVLAGTGEAPCRVASRFGRAVLWISTGLYAIGFGVAFLSASLARLLAL
jgi:hypothetical protein